MFRKSRIIVVIMVLLAAPSWAFAQMKEGLWEITSQTHIEGVPISPPPVTFKQCLSKKDAVPKDQDKSTECKIIKQKMSGNTLIYTTECKNQQGVMHATGNITYSGNVMEGKTTASFNARGQSSMKMNTSMKGRYLGTCPK
ncbi:MAG TPA: DUF3617 family protein [Smithellaceae bacterium]|jgi:hypothetical protein|nr:DUF3617 family protein [Smithellaceae bacterium]HQF83697.1 DUF3617 family protein [Smithellaceae bacterium]HQG79754.1 DUF3617 family protein [Smithellaceae bacterium]